MIGPYSRWHLCSRLVFLKQKLLGLAHLKIFKFSWTCLVIVFFFFFLIIKKIFY